MKLTSITLALFTATLALGGCGKQPSTNETSTDNKQRLDAEPTTYEVVDDYRNKLDIYTEVELNADLSHLTDNQKRMISLLIDASKLMDDLFWKQAFGGDKDTFLNNIADPATRRFAEINYGPWDRMNGDKPFLKGFAAKPLGAQFYPADMTKKELEDAVLLDGDGLYSVVRRNDDGKLKTIEYSELYKKELTQAADLLLKASTLAEDSEFANYLKMRSEALLTDDYQGSDFAWMNMQNNGIELVYGPIETYEDQLFGYRAGFESYVLIKDLIWSSRLAKYASTLPELQKGLPVPEAYKKEAPGANSQLNAYDVVYYAGHSNAGGKTIAINLPNDEQVQLQKGTRRLQLKNAMKAKFDKILLPIADVLIVPEQRQYITFNAFFNNTMFHEVAHGLGIKNTINGKGTVRQSLQEHASALEEGKADILGLYMIGQLLEQGVITEGQLEEYYTTFMAGIFRSVRFGASSAHGKANMVRFNYFQQHGAFQRTNEGLYRVDMDKMAEAIISLSTLILKLQGDGDYEGVDQLVKTSGMIKPELAADLARLSAANIPVDIVFKQGKEVLGLDKL